MVIFRVITCFNNHKMKKILLYFTALGLSTIPFQSFAEPTTILNGKLRLDEGKNLVNVVESEANPHPITSSDLEEALVINDNRLFLNGLSPIQSGVLKWKTLQGESIIPEGWLAYQLCDNNTCFTYLGENEEYWFEREYYQEFNTIEQYSDFYTTMYIPEGSEDEYGAIVVEVVYENGDEYYVDTFEFGFINLEAVNIDELEELTSFKLYPNPVKDDLYISMTERNNIQSISVFSITGRQLLKRENINNKEYSLNLSSLNSGIYLIRIEDINGQTAIKKISVQ